MKKALIPLALFLVLVGFLAVGLTRDPHEIPSPLVGKPAPTFSVPRLDSDTPFGVNDMRGKVWLLNVWASWCVSCKAEHALLVEFSRNKAIPIVGLNYKEARGSDIDVRKLTAEQELAVVRQQASAWLASHGDPYLLSALDIDGRVGINYGVYGVPETYLIDKAGVIRYKQIGPVTAEVLEQKIRPLAVQLQGQPG